MKTPSSAATLRSLLDGPGPVVAPGCYDALGAVLIEQAGFDVAYMTGFGTSASLIGQPDIGLLSQSEMADNVRRIVAATSLPVVADADTGYGNAVNVRRTVQLWERAGVAGLHLEDQVAPKRCGHLDRKDVVDAAEATGKIRAAVDARSNPDTVVIARTDAAAVTGLADAIERARRFADAGADLLFVEAMRTKADIETVVAALDGHRLVYNWVDGGASPALELDELRAYGFALVLVPVTVLLAATSAIRTSLVDLRRLGTPKGSTVPRIPFYEFSAMLGLDALDQFAKEHAGPHHDAAHVTPGSGAA